MNNITYRELLKTMKKISNFTECQRETYNTEPECDMYARVLMAKLHGDKDSALYMLCQRGKKYLHFRAKNCEPRTDGKHLFKEVTQICTKNRNFLLARSRG